MVPTRWEVASLSLAGQGPVVAQQWLVDTTAAGAGPADRRRLVVHGLSIWSCALL